MGYRLYGNDLDERHTALESGLGWVVKFSKTAFIGKGDLQREKVQGSPRRFVAFRLLDKGVPRHGYPLVFKGKPVGEVTSGTFSPSLQVGIGLGYVENLVFPQGTPTLEVKIHDREIPAEIVSLPFSKGTLS
jgi:aminomethyltransferase